MKLSEILKHLGLFSQDIKTRIKNKQIAINGEVVCEDIELDCIDINPIDVGEFIFDLISANNIFKQQLKIFPLEELFNSNIDNQLTKILEDYILIKISKKQMFLVRKNV